MTRLGIVAFCFCCCVGGQALADADTSEALFLQGRYPEVVKRASRGDAARLWAARAEIERGRDQQAIALLTPIAARGGTAAVSARLLLAKTHRSRGRLQDALDALSPIGSEVLEARYLRGLLYDELGRVSEHRETMARILRSWEAHELAADDWRALLYAAEAARYRSLDSEKGEFFDEANELYRAASELAPDQHEINLRWSEMLLSKYAFAEAAAGFRQVLRLNPRHPEAHLGLARVALEQSYDIATAERHIELAIAVHPLHPEALRLRAGISIDRNNWDAAQKWLKLLDSARPGDLEGASHRAAMAWIRDDVAGFERIRSEVFKVNPHFARFYLLVANAAVREHRYEEAIALARRAIEVRPRDYEAMAVIGTNYLRMGDEDEGLKWLRRAWKGDPYNVRTDNTLRLFEEIIPRSYVTRRSKHYRLRYPRQEVPVLERWVTPLVELAYQRFAKHYGMEPRLPVGLELFAEHDSYSVRSIGVPNLGALGICFGGVVTALSPSTSSINWGMILWHELAHVFAIQKSRARVPRWYTEGLSEYETMRARPEWRRENDDDIAQALSGGSRIPSVLALNHEFLSRAPGAVVRAYYLAALMIEFLAENYGFDRVVHGLELYGQNLETAAVIEQITGAPAAAFDRRFREHLRERLRPYQGNFALPVLAEYDTVKLQQVARRHTKDIDALRRVALAHFYDGNARAAATAARRTLEIAPQDTTALFVLAELNHLQGHAKEALDLYLRMLGQGADSMTIRLRIGKLYERAGEPAAAIKQYSAARLRNPQSALPYRALADLYLAGGRTEEAIDALASYVAVEQMDYDAVQQLVALVVREKRWPAVVVYGEMGVRIQPADPQLLLWLGEGYEHLHEFGRAVDAYAGALDIQPPLRRPALAEIGLARSHHALGDRQAAVRHLRAALRTEPENLQALELEQALRAPRDR